MKGCLFFFFLHAGFLACSPSNITPRSSAEFPTCHATSEVRGGAWMISVPWFRRLWCQLGECLRALLRLAHREAKTPFWGVPQPKSRPTPIGSELLAALDSRVGARYAMFSGIPSRRSSPGGVRHPRDPKHEARFSELGQGVASESVCLQEAWLSNQTNISTQPSTWL